jgi:hypothetical protein
VSQVFFTNHFPQRDKTSADKIEDLRHVNGRTTIRMSKGPDVFQELYKQPQQERVDKSHWTSTFGKPTVV